MRSKSPSSKKLTQRSVRRALNSVHTSIRSATGKRLCGLKGFGEPVGINRGTFAKERMENDRD